MQICSEMKASPADWEVTRSEEHHAVWAVYNEENWISYDDAKTAAYKAKWVADNGYAGLTVYSLSFDDFGGFCTSTKYPIIRAIHKVFNGGVDPTSGPDPTPAPGPETTTPGNEFHCTKEGHFRDPFDTTCRKYYYCVKNEMGVFEKSEFQCERGKAFDEVADKCDDREKVKECKSARKLANYIRSF